MGGIISMMFFNAAPSQWDDGPLPYLRALGMAGTVPNLPHTSLSDER